MVRKANCRKCIHCEYENKESLIIGCDILGRCCEKYTCKYFITEAEYIAAMETLKLIEEKNNNGRN